MSKRSRSKRNGAGKSHRTDRPGAAALAENVAVDMAEDTSPPPVAVVATPHLTAAAPVAAKVVSVSTDAASPPENAPRAPLSSNLDDDFFAYAEEDPAPRSIRALDIPDDLDEDERKPRVVPAAVLERRARLRRIVAGIVLGLCGLLVIAAAIGLHRIATAAKTLPAPRTTLALAEHVMPSIDETLPVLPQAPSVGPATAVAAPAASAANDVAHAEALAAPDTVAAEPVPSAAPQAVAALDPTPPDEAPVNAQGAQGTVTPDPASAEEPKRAARSLIDRGRARDGIPLAREAIEHDPTDAESYLLLGAALQEVGKWKESIDVFSQCVHDATRGPKRECRALGGH